MTLTVMPLLKRKLPVKPCKIAMKMYQNSQVDLVVYFVITYIRFNYMTLPDSCLKVNYLITHKFLGF